MLKKFRIKLKDLFYLILGFYKVGGIEVIFWFFCREKDW